MRTVALIVSCLFALSACTFSPHKTTLSEWAPNDSTLISPTQNMKTWGGKEIPNTALVGKWLISYTEQSDMVLSVEKDSRFQWTVPASVDDKTKTIMQDVFSKPFQEGYVMTGTVKCYDEWLAEGNGPDGCYVVGFFDDAGNLLKYFVFVYCQINDNEFTFDDVDGDRIDFWMTPEPKRQFKELQYPEDYM